MSIQSEITLLQNTKGEIRNAIMEKGVTVTSSDLFSTYPRRISRISMTPGDKDALFRSLIERTATSLVIPEGTEVIRYGAFNHYETLTSVTIPNTVTTICHGAFGGTKGITSIVIPNSVTTIEETAFSSSGLTSVTLPSSVTSIEGYTFSNCTSLASVTIPNSVTIIKQYAFENCTSLTSVNIPDSVESINRYAFTGCSNLASITFNSTTPPTLASHALDNTNNCPIYVPEESVDAYKTAWTDYASRIQAIPEVKFFRRIQHIEFVTEGKYLIVDTANNIALNASLITSTTSGRNGINANNNYISVDITGDTIEATETTLNAAVDYDGGIYLTWTDENTGTVYYLLPYDGTGAPFDPSATSPMSEITPYDNNNGGITFKVSSEGRAIALFTNTSNNSKFRWQATTTPSNFNNVALFKLG